MKKVIFISIFLTLSVINTFSQTNDKLVCPKISITNPLERVNPGEVMTFTANIEGVDLQKHEIIWKVNKGEILQGQGTLILLVDTTGLSQEAIFAEVKLKGIRGGCRNSAKGFGTISSVIGNYDPDEFGKLSDEDVKARMIPVVVELQNDKSAVAYIINYGSLEDVQYRKNLIMNYLNELDSEVSRIEFVDGGRENSVRTRIFIQSCGDVKIKGPSSSINIDEPMIFSVESDNIIYNSSLKYRWTVNKGTIIQGQGTDMIVVDTTGLSSELIEANLEIEGLPERCQDKFSENGLVSEPEIGEPFDSFRNIPNDDDVRYRLDLFFITITQNLNSTGIIINYGSAENVRKREKIVREQAKFRNIDTSRILFIYKGEEKEIRTTLITAGEGADASYFFSDN